jgi:hypothetical protein
MMIDIATVGDFTAKANSTDVTVKIPTAGMACKIAKMTAPSCCKKLSVTCVGKDSMWNASRERHPL